MTMKVLVIDDEEDNRQIANLALTMIGGWTVIEADGGEAGVRLAEAENQTSSCLTSSCRL